MFRAVFASCSSHLLVGNLGWPSLPGRKSTPSSTRGQRLTMALNKLGSTLSSTPQRPTRWRDMFFWRFRLLNARAVGVLWHSRLLRVVVFAGSFYACTTSAVRLTSTGFDLCASTQQKNRFDVTLRCCVTQLTAAKQIYALAGSVMVDCLADAGSLRGVFGREIFDFEAVSDEKISTEQNWFYPSKALSGACRGVSRTLTSKIARSALASVLLAAS